MASKELVEFAQRADEAECVLATIQAQIDYLSTINVQQVASSNKQETEIEIEDLILKELDEEKCIDIDSRDFARKYNVDKNDIYGACNALEAENYIIKKQKKSQAKTLVSEEGIKYIKNGSPECQLIKLLLQLPCDDCQQISFDIINKNKTNDLKNAKIFNIAKNKACKNKWIKVNKKQQTIQKLVQSVRDDIQQQLICIQSSNDISQFPAKVMKELKSRKLLESKASKYYIISRGKSYSPKRRPQTNKITLDILDKHLNLDSNEWTGPAIKAFNFNAKGQKLSYGSLHPLMKMRREMRRILLDMGFQEMETNRYVESSFWNFDTLFQPQQHPARDAHDTFFLDQPKQCNVADKYKQYMQRVAKTHSSGGYGSIGWRYDWKQSEANKNLLRTHTTAVSSRTLFKLAQLKPFKAVKYFSIDRVFRNESIDATHLAEFHQVEGFVADYDLTLGHLLGVIGEFFKRIGIPNVRFKPAYNPYTEPSMEIFGWSNERQDWIEVGNSGVFRPEMLEPMGLPKNVKVIAWGLGLERPCMIATGVKDIRELFGPRVDINMVKTFPIVRYDDTAKQQRKDNKKKNQGFKDM